VSAPAIETIVLPWKVRQALAWEAVRTLGKVRSRPVKGGVAYYLDFRPKGPKVYTYRTPWGAEVPFATEIDARMALAEIRRRVVDGADLALAIDSIRPRERASILARARVWLAEKRAAADAGDLSPASIEEIECHLSRHWPRWTGASVFDIRAGVVRDWSAELFEKGLAPGTVRNVLAYFHAFLVWLDERDEIERVPAFPTIRVTRRERPTLTIEQQGKVLAAIAELVGEADPRFGLMLLATELALRPNEARALAIASIEADEILIRHAVKGESSRAPIRGTKTGLERRLPMPPLFREWAAQHLTPEVRMARLLAFPNPSGLPWSQSSLQILQRAACARAGVPYVPPRDATRKSTSMEFRRRLSADYSTLRELLGHAQQQTTEIYVPPRHAKLGAAVHELSTLRRPSPPKSDESAS
jgi:integrase